MDQTTPARAWPSKSAERRPSPSLSAPRSAQKAGGTPAPPPAAPQAVQTSSRAHHLGRLRARGADYAQNRASAVVIAASTSFEPSPSASCSVGPPALWSQSQQALTRSSGVRQPCPCAILHVLPVLRSSLRPPPPASWPLRPATHVGAQAAEKSARYAAMRPSPRSHHVQLLLPVAQQPRLMQRLDPLRHHLARQRRQRHQCRQYRRRRRARRCRCPR